MVARQASRLAASAAGPGVAALGACVGSVGGAPAATDDISPDSRLAAKVMPRNLAARPCAELEFFMCCPLTNEPSGGRDHAILEPEPASAVLRSTALQFALRCKSESDA